MQDVAVVIAQHLDLDMFTAGDVAFQEHGRIAKGPFRFRTGFVEARVEFRSFLHNTHAPATAAEGGLDDEREPDFFGFFESGLAFGDRFGGAGEDGDAGFGGGSAGGDFVAHFPEQFGAGTDEGNAGLGAGAGEIGVLR